MKSKKTAEWDLSLERQIQAIRQDEYDDGYEAGEKNGKSEGKIEGKSIILIQQVQKKIKKGKSLPEISDELETSEEEIKPYYNTLMVKGIECDAEEILKEIQGDEK